MNLPVKKYIDVVALIFVEAKFPNVLRLYLCKSLLAPMKLHVKTTSLAISATRRNIHVSYIIEWHDSILENLGKSWKSCCFCFIITSQHKNGVVPSLAKSFYRPSIGQDFGLGPRLKKSGCTSSWSGFNLKVLGQSWKKESFFLNRIIVLC